MSTSHCKKLWRAEDGQDLVEYSLLLAFIALAAVGVLTSVEGNLKTLWTTASTKLGAANTAAST